MHNMRLSTAAWNRLLQTFKSMAKQSGSEWTQCNAEHNANKAAAKMSASKDALNQAKNREGLSIGGRMDDGIPDSFNDFRGLGETQASKYSCPKFDLFGCGCTDLPGYETLSGGDCSTLKGMLRVEDDST